MKCTVNRRNNQGENNNANKPHTGTSVMKDFVKRMLRKRSGDATTKQADANEMLTLVLKLMKRTLESNGADGDNQRLYKVTLTELIIPKIINTPVPGGGIVDHEKAKDWAFACAQLLGFMAGLSLQENAIDGAVNQAAKIAKECGHLTAEHIAGALGVTSKPAPRKVGTSRVSGASLAGNAAGALEQKEKMIVDLDTEAMIEEGKGNLAAAAALKVMAGRMKQEVEIEKDLNKQGKSAA